MESPECTNYGMYTRRAHRSAVWSLGLSVTTCKVFSPPQGFFSLPDAGSSQALLIPTEDKASGRRCCQPGFSSFKKHRPLLPLRLPTLPGHVIWVSSRKVLKASFFTDKRRKERMSHLIRCPRWVPWRQTRSQGLGYLSFMNSWWVGRGGKVTLH